MTRLEILTEEKSMAEFLKGILPRLLPRQYALNQNCFIHPHNGKVELQNAIPRKMRRYHHDIKVLIIHDQDHGDCKALKQRLRQLAGDHPHVLIRIACRELENWYLGDFAAIDRAYPRARAQRHRNKAIYRNPDNPQGATEMEKLAPNEFAKTDAAQRLPQHMTIAANTSPSFNHLVSGLQKFLQ